MGKGSAAAAGPPEVLAGRYRVERLLGEGGLGSVYAVRDVSTGKRIALKQLSTGASAAAAALFEREYHSLSGLRHPNIVEVYDYGRDRGVPFYTMELIEGGDLSAAAPMPWREVCQILRDVASILGVLHARRLVHRDLSPRNMLRSQSGRLKLIDFGALTPFGVTLQLVGTPPFVAPEAARAAPLDQRTDLFALGALAYWLLSGAHAFPAQSLADLPRLWAHAPVPPSELLELLDETRHEPIPSELDALIAALLRIDPVERLGSTAELIDRLNALAGLAPEAEDLTVKGYLDSKAFVGRARERERALSLLSEASQGKVRTLLVEGDPGLGRTRLLQELVVLSRLRGAVPLVSLENQGTRPYATAGALLLALLRAAPTPALEVARGHAAALSYVSREVSAELSVGPRPSITGATSEVRVRVLAALRDVVLAVSASQLVCVVVDDLQNVDEESQALLTALQHAEGEHRLAIFVAAGGDSQGESAAVLANLRANAARIRLLPLTVEEMLELLRSVFGQAPYLERLAERLHRASDGNPAFCLELAQHLVQTGLASYQDGAWSLPVELSLESLPKSRQAACVARLDRLSSDARQLARCLSIPHSTALSAEQCLVVSDYSFLRVSELLRELEREQVVCAVADGHRFVHASVQSALYEELDQAGRTRAHLGLGAQIAAQLDRDVIDVLRACAHFLRGGDLVRAFQLQQEAINYFSRGELSLLSRAAPLLEEVYTLHRERGHDKYAVVGPLGLLGIAGFYADRSYARKYGDLSIATMQDVLRLPLARRLTPVLGAKLALIAALQVAGVALHRRRDRAPSVVLVTRHLLGTASSLAGTAACCVDPDGVARYAEVIAPFTVFGKDQAAAIMHEAACSTLYHLRDQPALARERVTELIERLESPRPIADLPDTIKANYLWGALSVLGVVQSWRDAPDCLQTADRLEQCSPLYAMNADYLRSSYYAGQGDQKRAAYFRQRMEVHAVQLGSAWQSETWAPTEAVKLALRLHDPSILKRGIQELSRLSSELPSLLRSERLARGTYLVLRGKYAQALPLLETDDPPGSFAGWTNNRGVLACAYNELGEHARAKEICTQALSQRRPEDLTYVALNLNVQVEFALAEAGLGNTTLAARLLDDLLVQNAPDESAITLGLLHHARARVALRERDFSAAREHLRELEVRYRSTGVATLIEVVEAFKRELARAQGPQGRPIEGDQAGERAREVMTCVRLLRSQDGSAPLAARANAALQMALQLTRANLGCIVMADGGGEPVAHIGTSTLPDELVMWAEQSMLDAGVDEQTLMTDEVRLEVEANHKVVGPVHYCVVPLWARVDREEQVVAALLLGFEDRIPCTPEPIAVHAIARHLLGN